MSSDPAWLGPQSILPRHANVCHSAQESGLDFGGYRLPRSIAGSNAASGVLQIPSLEAYADRLRQHPGEINTLVRDLLSRRQGVRGAGTVMPRLFEDKGPSNTINRTHPVSPGYEEPFDGVVSIRRTIVG